MIYLYTKKLSRLLDEIFMTQVDKRRALIYQLVQKTKKEANGKKKKIETIDPLLKVGRKIYPYLPERELHECACSALRVIKYGADFRPYQTKLGAFDQLDS